MNIKKFYKTKRLFAKPLIIVSIILFFISNANLTAQQQSASMRVGRFWTGITDNGYRGNFTYSAGFFPNDYDILGWRGQYMQANSGSGFQIGTTRWFNPYNTDSVKFGRSPNEVAAIHDMVDNDFLPTGKITTPLTNYIRNRYPDQTIVNPTLIQTVTLPDFGSYDQSKFSGGTYDQVIDVTNEYVYGITLHRRIMGWSQNYNSNYIIYDYEFTNNSDKVAIFNGKGQTYDSLYIQTYMNLNNGEYSNGRTPGPQGNEIGFEPSKTWQHYHGGRASDTLKTFVSGKVPGKLRVFYEYGADDANRPGDNMGAPIASQQGRLIGTGMNIFTVLHASKLPYVNPQDDVDDFLQPKTTYTGNSSQIPYTSNGDPYGSKNFWAMRGGLFGVSKMNGDTFAGTQHSVNPDESGNPAYYDYVTGATNENFMYSSFGPYTLAPGQKIHIVYACGWAGIDPKTAQDVGKKWNNGTLQNPPNMPDQNTGWLPSNFSFPKDATPIDKVKDRWISMGIDSVMLTAFRAKWNYDHNYEIPQAPPPPSKIKIWAYGDGTEVTWSDPDAESLSNFAGYRISRRISNVDTSYYEIVYDSDKNDKAQSHSYKDSGVLALAQYYYFIQSKALIDPNDLNADQTTRGKMMYSGRTYVPNVYWVNPPRLSQEDLSKIRIAPNPYNINDPLLVTYGYTDQRGINFYNLPVACSIRIFTENGDLVQTIIHESTVKAGSETWDMLTSSQQVISSGVYIAVIQKPTGEMTYLKFVVVR